MRCPRCGNENPETNRFCGMCGATLLQTPAITTPASASAAVPQPSTVSSTAARPQAAQSSLESDSRASAPASEPSPVISGPSFLGLNDPPPRKRGNLSIDPRGTNSRNLDYLLDDEEPRRGGAGKFVLIMVALALAVGLGYLRWKNQGFGWLNAGSSKPSPAAQTSSTPDSGSAQPTPANTQNSVNPAPTQNAGSSGAASQPAGDSASSPSAPVSQTPASSAPVSSTPVSSTPSSGTPAAGTTTLPGTTTTPDTTDSGAANPASNPQTAPTNAAPDSNPTASNNAPAASEKLKSPPVETPPKPPAIVKPARTVDPVSEAQKYLYGKGARQDCDRGMRILKPVAEHSNPKAMVEMGALYSAGLCTPRDLPTAYRWFALALRKEPDNQAVQTDLQKLWGEMTQPERQLAIRMSQ